MQGKPGKEQGGGVCILVKDSTEYFERKGINTLSGESNFEVCSVEIPNMIFLLISIYWPNSGREIESFFTCLTNLLKIISIIDNNIVTGGDLNVNFLKDSKLESFLSNLFLTYNFHILVKEATRVTATSSSCLDVIFTNFDKNYLKVHNQELGLSDHKGIELNVPLSTRFPCIFFISKRIFNGFNIEQFKSELSTIKWENIILTNKSVDENYENFKETLSKALNYNIIIIIIIFQLQKN